MNQREAVQLVRENLGRSVKVLDSSRLVEGVYVLVTEDDNVMPGIGSSTTVRVTVFIGDTLDSQSIVRTK